MSELAEAKPALDPAVLRVESRRWGRALDRAGVVGGFLTILVFAALYAAPIYWLIATSLKTSGEVFKLPPVWWPSHPLWHNYPNALDYFPFVRYALNTLRIAAPVAIGTTVSSSLVAYGFSRMRWPGRDLVFYLVLATLMIPSWVTLVPLYILFNRIGWVDTYRPLVIPAFFGDPFSIFLLRQFFLRQPQDLVDAARVDGASHLRIFIQIILPLSRPALAVVALFAFINSWTDFFNPLIYLSNPDKYTLQVGLYNFFAQHFVNWPGFMAASVMVLAPVVVIFFLAQKTFIEGITFTGLRG